MDKDTLDDDKQAFKEAVDAESEQRKQSLEQLKFSKLGEQWPEKVRQQREDEGRPCLTINRCPSFAKQVTNDARQNRPSIAVHPVGNGADKDTAGIYNGLIRNIQNISRADIVYDTALDFAVHMGFGYMRADIDYACDDTFDQDILIRRIANPFSVYGDPRSTEADSSDWNSAFVVDMMSQKEFKRKFPGASLKGFDTDGSDEATQLWYEDKSMRVAERWIRDEVDVKLLKLSDGSIMHEEEYLKPDNQAWFQAHGLTVEGDRKTKTYRVKQRIITGEEVLEENDWRGKYIPIIPVYGDEANVEGKRIFQGLFKFAMDPQRMLNYWRTASTELVALAPKAPFIGAVGAFNTDPKWTSANNASHAYIEYDPVQGEPKPERQPFTGVPAGALQEALNATDDMKNILGIHDASLGARSNETSGVAIKARKIEGDVSTFNFIDNLSRGIEHLGRVVVDLIPKVYTAPRIIRCIKEDGSTYSVPVNQPVVPAPPEQGQQPTPGMPQEQFQPHPEEVPGLTKIFDLTTGKYDVTVAAGPSFTSRREESAEQMMEFIRVFPQSAPLIGDLLAKNLDWPGSDEVAARLKAMLPPQAQGQVNAVVQQLQQQLQQMDQQAKQAVGQLQDELKKAQQQAADKTLDAQLKARELAIKEFEAETDRLRAGQEAEASRRESETRVIESANQASAAQATASAQPSPVQ